MDRVDAGLQPACVTKCVTGCLSFGIATEVMGASFRNLGQITALAGCDLLTISPELLAQLQATSAALPRALDAETARRTPVHATTYNEPAFRYALNDDAMATEKLAEGIRAFAADAARLEKTIDGLS
jgi:transaldolase